VQAIIAAFGLLSLGRIIMGDKGVLFATLSALAFGCGFWIGAEALPWAILFIACLGVAAAWQSGNVARNAALFGLCLSLFTAALIPVALPASEFSSRALSWFSPAYAIFAALAGGVLIIGWALGRLTPNKILRLALYAACGSVAMLIFFILIPSATQGIFTDYDRFDATTALDNIGEAVPLTKMMHINRYMPASFVPALLVFSRLLVLPIVALGACWFAARKARGAVRLVWLSHGVFLGAATALAIFWQNCVGVFMEIFMLVPLLWLLSACWDRLSRTMVDTPPFWIEICAFLLLLPLPTYLLPIEFNKIYPTPPPFAPPCTSNLDTITQTLNDPSGLGAQTHTIMNVSDVGPELLLQTHHNVVAGNFDVPGNADAFTFFNSADDTPARKAAQKWNADLVLICHIAPELYLGKDYYQLGHARLQPDGKGMLRMINTDPQQPLIERLIRAQIPDWLKPVEIPGGSDYLLFEVTNTGQN